MRFIRKFVAMNMLQEEMVQHLLCDDRQALMQLKFRLVFDENRSIGI
jgi:hypothetical protein